MTDADFWAGRTVMVTGRSGFLGSHLVEELESRSDDVEVFVPWSNEYDLRERAEIRRALSHLGADTVIHLAETVGGIGANRENPRTYFYENAIMGIELMEMARKFNVDKLTIAGTICLYPKHTEVPFKEEDLFKGSPKRLNAPYGIAKKSLLTQSRAYRKQYNFKSIYLMPVNLYGPETTSTSRPVTSSPPSSENVLKPETPARTLLPLGERESQSASSSTSKMSPKDCSTLPSFIT